MHISTLRCNRRASALLFELHCSVPCSSYRFPRNARFSAPYEHSHGCEIFSGDAVMCVSECLCLHTCILYNYCPSALVHILELIHVSAVRWLVCVPAESISAANLQWFTVCLFVWFRSVCVNLVSSASLSSSLARALLSSGELLPIRDTPLCSYPPVRMTLYGWGGDIRRFTMGVVSMSRNIMRFM